MKSVMDLGRQAGRAAPLWDESGRAVPIAASVDDWAEAIKRGYACHVCNVIAFGRLVHASRLVLEYGEWEELFRHRRERGMPFAKSTGKQWDQIGEVCGELGQDADIWENCRAVSRPSINYPDSGARFCSKRCWRAESQAQLLTTIAPSDAPCRL